MVKEIEENTTSGKISIHGLVELILLKRPHYPNPSKIQFNLNQNYNDVFHRNAKDYLKTHMQPQRIPNSENNLEKEEQSWRHHTS